MEQAERKRINTVQCGKTSQKNSTRPTLQAAVRISGKKKERYVLGVVVVYWRRGEEVLDNS